jgi:hypothetical protein
MLKSADQIENNPLRPELKDYIEKGFVTTKTKARFLLLKNNASDYAISLLAKSLRE